MRRRTKSLIWIVAALAVFVTALWQQRAEYAPDVQTPHASVTVPAAPSNWSRVHEVVPAAERDALLATLALIDRDGPYPYRKDGSTFSNREALLVTPSDNLVSGQTVQVTGRRFGANTTGGTLQQCTADLTANPPTIVKGDSGNAQCTIEVAHDDFKTMLSDPNAGMQLYFQGKLRVSGDPMLAMKLQQFFDIAKTA